jgi:hypothetical protein
MPIVDFDRLPDSARIWVYGSDRDLDEKEETTLLEAVDEFLTRWAAHGVPLHSARRWDEGRFLTIGVDSTKEGASGCSIDGLYRALKSLEPTLGACIVTSGLVYYRGNDGKVHSVTRDEFADLAAKGEVSGETEVYDLSVTSLNEWRSRFRSRAADSWHASLMPETSTKA